MKSHGSKQHLYTDQLPNLHLPQPRDLHIQLPYSISQPETLNRKLEVSISKPNLISAFLQPASPSVCHLSK